MSNWLKSSRCDVGQVGGGCVEVAVSATGAEVRHATVRTSPVLRFTAEEWNTVTRAFLDGPDYPIWLTLTTGKTFVCRRATDSAGVVTFVWELNSQPGALSFSQEEMAAFIGTQGEPGGLHGGELLAVTAP